MSRRRKKWTAPNNPTPMARQVWRAVYPHDPWPKGWRVQWVGYMRGAFGLTEAARKRIILSHADCARRTVAVEILLHEFIHMRAWKLRHGPEFLRLLNAARSRLGFGPATPEQEWHSEAGLKGWCRYRCGRLSEAGHRSCFECHALRCVWTYAGCMRCIRARAGKADGGAVDGSQGAAA